MKCQCGKDQRGNFCSNCGQQLKEKCEQCGKMEWVGRPFCEERYIELKKELNIRMNECETETIGPRATICCLLFWVGASLYLIYVINHESFSLGQLALVCLFWVGCIVGAPLFIAIKYAEKELDKEEKLREKIREQFYESNPQMEIWESWINQK